MRRRKSTIFFLVLGILLISLAVALQVGWILLNLQQVALLILGIVFFALIITGLVLNTTFLVREIRKNEEQNAFLNAMTHELKTPIASIRLYLETLKTRELSKDKEQEFYDVMLADSDRLLNTVEQVLEASKTRERSRKLNISKVDIGLLLNECAELISSRYHLSPEIIKLGILSEKIFIRGDHDDLQTVFLNLLDNAVKYSGDLAEVNVKFRIRQGNVVEIHIKDKGVGIPSSDLKRIFKRFYRVPRPVATNPKGTGLGLYIVRSIIKSHSGKIFVRSKGEGMGTTFIVRLPIKK